MFVAWLNLTVSVPLFLQVVQQTFICAVGGISPAVLVLIHQTCSRDNIPIVTDSHYTNNVITKPSAREREENKNTPHYSNRSTWTGTRDKQKRKPFAISTVSPGLWQQQWSLCVCQRNSSITIMSHDSNLCEKQ